MSGVCQFLKIDSRCSSSFHTYSKLFLKGESHKLEISKTSKQFPGTVVTVSDLFHIMPVRKKCSNSVTELRNVEQMVESVALLHSNVSFVLINQETDFCIFETFGKASTIITNFSRLFGSSTDFALKKFEHESSGVKLVGYVGIEPFSRKTFQFLYINGLWLQRSPLHKLLHEMLCLSTFMNSSVNKKDENFSASENHGVYIINILCEFPWTETSLLKSRAAVECEAYLNIKDALQNGILEFLTQENLLSSLSMACLQADKYNISEKCQSVIPVKYKEKEERSGSKVSLTNRYKGNISTSNITNNLHSDLVQRHIGPVKEIPIKDRSMFTSGCNKKLRGNENTSDSKQIKHTPCRNEERFSEQICDARTSLNSSSCCLAMSCFIKQGFRTEIFQADLLKDLSARSAPSSREIPISQKENASAQVTASKVSLLAHLLKPSKRNLAHENLNFKSGEFGDVTDTTQHLYSTMSSIKEQDSDKFRCHLFTEIAHAVPDCGNKSQELNVRKRPFPVENDFPTISDLTNDTDGCNSSCVRTSDILWSSTYKSHFALRCKDLKPAVQQSSSCYGINQTNCLRQHECENSRNSRVGKLAINYHCCKMAGRQSGMNLQDENLVSSLTNRDIMDSKLVFQQGSPTARVEGLMGMKLTSYVVADQTSLSQYSYKNDYAACKNLNDLSPRLKRTKSSNTFTKLKEAVELVGNRNLRRGFYSLLHEQSHLNLQSQMWKLHESVVSVTH